MHDIVQSLKCSGTFLRPPRIIARPVAGGTSFNVTLKIDRFFNVWKLRLRILRVMTAMNDGFINRDFSLRVLPAPMTANHVFMGGKNKKYITPVLH